MFRKDSAGATVAAAEIPDALESLSQPLQQGHRIGAARLNI